MKMPKLKSDHVRLVALGTLRKTDVAMASGVSPVGDEGQIIAPCKGMYVPTYTGNFRTRTPAQGLAHSNWCCNHIRVKQGSTRSEHTKEKHDSTMLLHN